MTFIGRYYHALEQKGRLSIPASFRANLGTAAVLTAGLDGCLFLLDNPNWETIVTNASQNPFTKKQARDWGRYLANNAVQVEFDRLGRVLIPDFLRERAGLNKEVVVVGSLNRVEIWDRETYHRYIDGIAEKVEEIAEQL